MIRGHFATLGTRRRPFVKGVLHFPTLNRDLELRLLVDTGADRTILGPAHAERLRTELGMDFTALRRGQPGTGIGGQVATRIVEAVLNLETVALPPTLTILEPTAPLAPIPSLLGRDILAHFALFLEERTTRVLLLEPAEADALKLP